jgi:hypothetical protein
MRSFPTAAYQGNCPWGRRHVVAAWHGHTERMTQAVYGRVTDDRLTAAADVFLSGRTDFGHKASCGSLRLTSQTPSDTGQNGFSTWS